MKIPAIRCPRCGDTIYSRAREDIRQCSCGACSVNGGREIFLVSWQPGIDKPEIVNLDIDTDEEILYDDWNESKNEYGIIKQEKH